MAGNTEMPTIDRNTKFPEEFDAVIYDITNVFKNFGNDLQKLK